MGKFMIFWLLLGISLCSCKQETFSTQAELLQYLHGEDSEYVQEKTINGVTFSLAYRPTDMLVAQEINEEINSEELAALREKYKGQLYFNLSMSARNKELLSSIPNNRNEFGAMVNQLAFGMGEKAHLITQRKDTLEMQDFIYPRMYGMSNATTIMFVYPRKEESLKEDYMHFTLEDIGLQVGEVKFKIPTDIIKEEPKLSF